MPIFSIVTVTLNPGYELYRTFESILKQSFSDYEWIVKDGGSTDSSADFLLNNYVKMTAHSTNSISYTTHSNPRKKLPGNAQIHFIEKKDSSIYDAMNQALEMVSGKWIIFLNAGDTFANQEVLQNVNEYISKNVFDLPAVLCGKWIIGESHILPPSILDYDFLYRDTLCHQAMFYSTDFFRKYGGYDTNFRICADFETVLKIKKFGVAYFDMHFPICIYACGGISGLECNRKRARYERVLLKWKYFPLLIFLKFLFFR